MAQNTMYISKNNSPQTTLTNEITATEQTIPVADVSKLPAAPNIASIGSGDNIELVYYAGVSGSTLTGCVRGYHGTTASIWYEDTPIYRAYTSYDHDTFKSNIEDLAANKLDKTGDGSSTTVAFTEAGTLANPATGESQATLWGKILKLFNSTSGHDHDGTNSKKIAASNVDGLADYFDASTGHDHDGTDSKKIAYANVTGTPTIPTVPSFESSASNIKADGTASVGSLSTVPRADHVHPIADSGWIAPTFQNSWKNSTVYGDFYAQVGYRKIGNIVYLRGVVDGGTTAQSVIFTLPAGYRPSAGKTSVSVDDNGIAVVFELAPNGELYCWNAASNYGVLYLNGLSFLID